MSAELTRLALNALTYVAEEAPLIRSRLEHDVPLGTLHGLLRQLVCQKRAVRTGRGNASAPYRYRRPLAGQQGGKKDPR